MAYITSYYIIYLLMCLYIQLDCEHFKNMNLSY